MFFTHDYRQQVSSEPLDTLNVHLNFDSVEHPGIMFFFSLHGYLMREAVKKVPFLVVRPLRATDY